jgi:flagellar protein FliO/FliZ
VLGRVTLGRNASVTVVRVGGRALVLGVSEQQVTLLTETDPAELTPPNVDPESPGTAAPGGFPPASSAWKAVVEQLRDRTVRR